MWCCFTTFLVKTNEIFRRFGVHPDGVVFHHPVQSPENSGS